MIEIEASGLVTKKKRTLKERIAQTFKIILDIPDDLPGLKELTYLLSPTDEPLSSTIHRWYPWRISDFHVYDKPNYPVKIDPQLVFAEVTLKWKCKECTGRKTEKIYYELPGIRHPHLPDRYWQREYRTLSVYTPKLSSCVANHKAKKEAQRLAREANKKRLEAEMQDYEERIKKRILEENIKISNSLFSDRSKNTQIARNIKILRTKSLSTKSRRFYLAIYRLFELGFTVDCFSQVSGIKQVNGLMIWYRVKKSLCLNDSSCGMREFFE